MAEALSFGVPVAHTAVVISKTVKDSFFGICDAPGSIPCSRVALKLLLMLL